VPRQLAYAAQDPLASAGPDIIREIRTVFQFGEKCGLDAHDDRGDRFRYPASKESIPYPSSSANLDDLFRAHYL